MITPSEQSLLDEIAERQRKERIATGVILRERFQRSQAAALASVYPFPHFARVENVAPYDPWAGWRPLTIDEIRTAEDPAAIPPAGWLNLPSETRARLGGLARMVIDRFPPDADRRRRPRIVDAVSLALAAASSASDELSVLRRMHDTAAGPILETFAGLACERAEWILVRRDVRDNGDSRLLRVLIEKLDRPAGVFDRLLAVFKSAMQGAR
jgi:hypothetical protein